MRTAFDFSPLFRSSIGFDRMLNALDAASRIETIDNWPPYDIAKTSEDDYRITMAVAGFSQDELTLTQEQNMLVVSGQKTGDDKGGDNSQYLHRGIAGRAFQRRFELADHVKVVGAALVNGLLTIDLKREIPEEMKPRKIEIAADTTLPKGATKQIEAEKKVA
ncbi:Hsp20 family protein [Mesorhizobium sp. WSM3626]|uniref:Hsp20 family protein n=1 Tax=Mesorhizobium sp. WSM3626 TaxID=1040987 RepID=UPI0004853019|nr:Hsp20 family protein [Mesorhizobium sp. WSM3626]